MSLELHSEPIPYFTQGSASIKDAKPETQRLFFLFLSLVYWRHPSAQIVVTSVLGQRASHRNGYAIDIDIGLDGKFLKHRHPRVRESLLLIKGIFELYTPYGLGYDGQPHHTMVWETDDRHQDHVHLQVPSRARTSDVPT